MGILSDLHRQIHASPMAPVEILIDDNRVTELAIELDGMTSGHRSFMQIEKDIRSGECRLFGRPLRVRADGHRG